MKDILKLIKSTSIDLWMLFKNFIHWNISKIIISIASIGLSFLLSLPFIVILVIIYFSFGLNQYLTSFDVSFLDLLTLFRMKPFVSILFIFFVLIVVVLALFGYSYRKVLFTKLNLKYLDGKKLDYLKNYYFDFKMMKRYFQVIALFTLIISIPILSFFIIFFILFFIFGGSDGVQSMILSSQFNLFTILILLLLIICFVAFVYVSYRTYFSIIMLVDKKHYEEEKSPMFYISESFIKTRSIYVFMRFILIMILLSFVTLPMGKLQEHFSSSLKEIRAYKDYVTLGETEKKVVLENPDYNYIIDLKDKYSTYSEKGIEKVELTYFYLDYFFVILNFLIIFGLFEMTVVSFYKYEIIKKKTILSNDIPK